MEKAQPVGVFFLASMGSSLLTQGLVLESFGNLTSNTSNFIVFIILWFRGLLYLVAHGNRVIIPSISVVLVLGILVDAPYRAGFVITLGGSDSPLGVSIIHVSSGGKVGNSVSRLSVGTPYLIIINIILINKTNRW